MSVEYFEEEIKEHERSHHGPFIGYISPEGKLINYSMLLGPKGHDNWRNPATITFLYYLSFILPGHDIEEFKNSNNEYLRKMYEAYRYHGSMDIKEWVIRGYYPEAPLFMNFRNQDSYEKFVRILYNEIDSKRKARKFSDVYRKLEYDLLEFFGKCYSKNDFFNSFGRIIKVPSEEETRSSFEKRLRSFEDYQKDEFIRDYYTYTLMNNFKDVLTVYLGYDSIERAREMDPMELVFYDHLHSQSNMFEPLPKPSIVTSCNSPYERFFNWILMDYEIIKVPKMIWDESEGRFVQSDVPSFHQFEREENTADEIRRIKSKVPQHERYKFFRQ